MLDAFPATTFCMFGLRDRLRICWLAYPEARLAASRLHQCIRGFTTMRYINRLFTYLLTS